MLTGARVLRTVLGLAIMLSALGVVEPVEAAVPAGFTDTLVASVGSPTALAFAPDGRLLITTQGSRLRIYQNGTLLSTAYGLDLTSVICSTVERGSLGVAVDPAFGVSNNYIYVYYTHRRNNSCSSSNAANRVSRFTLPDTNIILTSTETILIDNSPSYGGNHNAGDVQFGKDGYLYISVGDGGTDYAGGSGSGGSNDAAHDEFILLGKILRIDRDGNIPPDNPFQGTGTARCNFGMTTPGNKCQETFAWGLRNPFRIAFDPNAAGTRFYINDVGQGTWEQIDLGQAGVDYGWNCREGAHNNSQAFGKCSPLPPAWWTRSTNTTTTQAAVRSRAARSCPAASGPPPMTANISSPITCAVASSDSTRRAEAATRP